MKEELYRKVYIKSEADLPKESGLYWCEITESCRGSFHFNLDDKDDIDFYIGNVMFYLQPIEQSENLKGDYGHEPSITSFDTKPIEQKESKYCDCEQPDREIGYSYCHSCHRMVSDERIELILNQGNTEQQSQKVEHEEIIKALSGEKIEDVQTVTSTEYPVEQKDNNEYITVDDGSVMGARMKRSKVDAQFEQKESKTSVSILADISEDDKRSTIDQFVRMTAKATLELFMMLGLKKHIECIVKNEPTNQEFIFSFKTMEEYRQQGQPTDNEIEEWIYNDAHWAKTFINGAIYGAKAVRDGLIPKR
jgi:hypothetical protein